MLSRLLFLVTLLASVVVHADKYDIQIGAFKSPDASGIKLPAGVGELRTTPGPNGLTRFVVGPYASKAEAIRAQEALKAAGFDGAFLRNAQRTTDSMSARAKADAAANVAHKEIAASNRKSSELSDSDLLKLMALSEEERSNVVVLDGRLHRKVGSEFIPLDD